MRCAAVTQNVFLRSPNRNDAYNVFCVNSSGNLNNTNATNGYRVRPDSTGGEPVESDAVSAAGNHAGARSQSPSRDQGAGEQRGGDAATACGAVAISASGGISEDPVSYDLLWDAAQKCFKGTRWKGGVARTELNLPLTIQKLRTSIEDGTYAPKEPVRFKVFYPKERDIAAVNITDRIYQRALNDNLFYPSIQPHLIYDNAACQTGKGTDFARARLKRFMRECYAKHGAAALGFHSVYVDISGYYRNMGHEVASRPFYRYVPRRWADEAYRTINAQYGDGGSGVNAGSQLIQLAGISVPNSVDHEIKDRMGIRWYLRYMDDMVAIATTREDAELIYSTIVGGLGRLGFKPNRKKSGIGTLGDGIDFLGFRFRLTATGKVVMTVKSESVKRQRRHLKGIVRLAKSGGMTMEKADESYHGWRTHASKGDSAQLLKRMDKYYESLWKE